MDLRVELARFTDDPEYRRDPRALYDRLLREAPVLSPDDAGRMWFVSGYDEIVAVSKNPAAITDFAAAGVPLDRMLNYAHVVSKMLPMRAGRDHARLRRLATTAFSARTVAAVREGVTDAAVELIRPHLAAGQLDVVADIARPLPVAVSCALLDIPADDRPRVSRWAQSFVSALPVAARDPQAQQAIETDLAALRAYIDQLCAERAARPGIDLVSQLVAARRDGTIDDDELFAFVLMLFVNGLDTLTSGLTLAVWHVLQQREYLVELAEDVELSERVFDECLRLGSPVRASARLLAADVELAGHSLRKGSGVVLLYAAANRDPNRFPDPDRLDPYRGERRHLAFGHGAHHCLGAPLSLVAGGAVLRLLARHCDELRTPLTADTAPWQTALPFAGLDALPITFTHARQEVTA